MKSVYRGFTDPGEKSHRERELERLLVLAYHRGNVAILVAAFFAVWKLVPCCGTVCNTYRRNRGWTRQ